MRRTIAQQVMDAATEHFPGLHWVRPKGTDGSILCGFLSADKAREQEEREGVQLPFLTLYRNAGSLDERDSRWVCGDVRDDYFNARGPTANSVCREKRASLEARAQNILKALNGDAGGSDGGKSVSA